MHKYFYCLILFFLLFLHLVASDKIHNQNRLYEHDKLYQLIEALYLSGSEILSGSDLIVSYLDAKNVVASWKLTHANPNLHQQRILNEISVVLKNISNKNQIQIKAGVDYLQHSIPDCTETNPFYNKFRDQDFETKYDERGRFFDATLEMVLYKSLFLSTRLSFKNDWKNFNSNKSDFPDNLKDINANANEKSIISCRIDNVSISLGRDKLSLGAGEFSKLLISDNLPPTDHFRLSMIHKDNLALTFLIAWMKNAVLENERPKILYAHRLSYRFFNRIYLALTEMQMTNQDLSIKYINPFQVYHNEYDYPSQRNILTAIDAEMAAGYGVKMYASFAVDEIDVSALEENGDRGRESWGLIAGAKKVSPFGIYNSQFIIEWIKLTKWFYNHGFPWEDYYTLNFVYEEKEDKLEQVEFHRFIGHELGANAEAIMSRISWNGFNFSLKYIDQGKIPIMDRAFSQVADTVRSYSYVLGFQYRQEFWDNRIELKTAFFHTTSKNFHQTAGVNKSYSEFWLSLNYKFLDIKW